ncbi:MAG: dTDP-4-oxo-6-deoxy-D-allose reductase [Syntrophorhabdus sp. PtaU1.Bin002]|nr:MAG: dTDP-4-oxo-6-deoxy-D-allose reductase [Syntrophorhabdus sp. PtaB.Bin006]OPY71473.1 MAG: dTDP-4-oxo-6-deoxy-D-allose reductase [Syntrophorhabdus sp. PtaU1.Bin002]
MSQEHILLTGATGFIGYHVAGKLLAEGAHRVVAIVRGQGGRPDAKALEEKGAILLQGNFLDRDFIEEVFKNWPIRHVIHAAALRGGGLANENHYMEVNVRGTETLLDVALQNGVDKFLFLSSVGVHGTIPPELPGTVRTVLSGDNLYHKSKVLAELRVNEFIKKGLNAYIIRPTITYGPRDNGFPKTLVELVRKKMLLLSSEDIRIHLLDVESLANLVDKVIKSDGIKDRCFIAADRGPISLRGLVNLIHRHYHGKDYPPSLRLPEGAFSLLLAAFRATGSEKWVTRILLISQSWYYDISETMKAFSYSPADTQEAFIRTMLS